MIDWIKEHKIIKKKSIYCWIKNRTNKVVAKLVRNLLLIFALTTEETTLVT